VVVQVKWNGGVKIGIFLPIYRLISKTIQDTAIVTINFIILSLCTDYSFMSISFYCLYYCARFHNK